MLTLPRSLLAAVRVGLIEYLQKKTGIQWDYYKTLVLPEEGAKGAVFVSASRSPGGFNCFLATHEIQLEVNLAQPDHQEAQSLLCDWGNYLVEDVMRGLSKEGIYGEYRGVSLSKAMAGCKLSNSVRYFVQDSGQRQDIPEGIAIGTLQATYEFLYESEVQLY